MGHLWGYLNLFPIICLIFEKINIFFNIITKKVWHKYLRNKSWKPECVLSFNMSWAILVFYPEPKAWDIIYLYPSTHVKTQTLGIKVTNIGQLMLKLKTHSFDSDMSKSTNTVVYFDGKTVIYIYAWGHAIYAAKFEQTITHQHVHLQRKEGCHVRITSKQLKDKLFQAHTFFLAQIGNVLPTSHQPQMAIFWFFFIGNWNVKNNKVCHWLFSKYMHTYAQHT